MKKLFKIIVPIIIVILILLGALYYLLIPTNKIYLERDNKIITYKDLIEGDFLKSCELLENPLGLKGNIEVSNKEFRNIIYTLMKKYNISELKDTYIEIEDKNIKVSSPYEVLGFIESQFELTLVPKVVNNRLNIKVTDSKLGKINISNNILKRIMKSYESKIPFSIDGDTIIIDKSYTYPLVIDRLSVEKGKIILEIEVRIDNLLDFIKDYDININT
ncbi:hypothetical protein CHL78_006680 [Romboutsia weinsteinii]|uniref:DUF2140 family protein n=1 Tax=Romboutsia weinsteinii TaxID=2020949 RepID=A0A371J5L7_9FIRM|nr:hypothetical protein [Romboutsia weinsteinii]RDY27983.1 hypothetical protein CHL78_006680 [Romboutsia weinsteinii]